MILINHRCKHTEVVLEQKKSTVISWAAWDPVPSLSDPHLASSTVKQLALRGAIRLQHLKTLLKIASKNYPHKISAVYITGFWHGKPEGWGKAPCRQTQPGSPSWQNCEVGPFVLNCITSLRKDHNFLLFIPSQPKAQSLVVPAMALHPSSSPPALH